jgi:hypothetical protein
LVPTAGTHHIQADVPSLCEAQPPEALGEKSHRDLQRRCLARHDGVRQAAIPRLPADARKAPLQRLTPRGRFLSNIEPGQRRPIS